MINRTLPGGLTVRNGEIVAECERCGARLAVSVGLHTLEEFWVVLRERGWGLVEPAGARDAEDCVVLCRDCMASPRDARRQTTPQPSGGP
jgi:hypothetical protein